MISSDSSFRLQLECLIAVHLPELSIHLREDGIEATMYSSSWIKTLFSTFNSLPLELVERVWDVFLIKGWKIIYRVILGILCRLQVIDSNAWIHATDILMTLRCPVFWRLTGGFAHEGLWRHLANASSASSSERHHTGPADQGEYALQGDQQHVR